MVYKNDALDVSVLMKGASRSKKVTWGQNPQKGQISDFDEIL